MIVDYSKGVFFVKLIIVNYSKAVSVCAIKAYGEVQAQLLSFWTSVLDMGCNGLVTVSAILYYRSSNLN